MKLEAAAACTSVTWPGGRTGRVKGGSIQDGTVRLPVREGEAQDGQEAGAVSSLLLWLTWERKHFPSTCLGFLAGSVK